MRTNFLRLNDDKTEILLLGSNNLLKKMKSIKLNIGGCEITSVDKVRNIGGIFDNVLNMQSQINNICRSAWFHLRNIGKIRKYLDTDATIKAVNALVTSRIDNLNSLLCNTPAIHLKKIQRVHYAAARVILLSREKQNLLPLLKELHWLPLTYRIKFKVLVLTYKALNGYGPSYLSDLLTPVYNEHHSLRSNEQNLLDIPLIKSKVYGNRCYSVFAPSLWNSIPQTPRDIDDLSLFKKKLKTHFFKEAFNGV